MSNKQKIAADMAEALLTQMRKPEFGDSIALTFKNAGGVAAEGAERFFKAMGFKQVKDVNVITMKDLNGGLGAAVHRQHTAHTADHSDDVMAGLRKTFSLNSSKTGEAFMELSEAGTHMFKELAEQFVSRLKLAVGTSGNGARVARIAMPDTMDEAQKIKGALDVLGIEFTTGFSKTTKSNAFKIDTQDGWDKLTDIARKLTDRGVTKQPSRDSVYEVTR